MNNPYEFLAEGKMDHVKRVSLNMRVKLDATGTGDWVAGTVDSYDAKTRRVIVLPADGTDAINVHKDALYKATQKDINDVASLHKDIRKQKQIAGTDRGREELVNKGLMPLTKTVIDCDRCGHKGIEVWSNNPKTACPECHNVLYAADKFDDSRQKLAARKPQRPQSSTEWLLKISAEVERIHPMANVDLYDYHNTGARQFCVDLTEVPEGEHASAGQKYFYEETQADEAYKMVQQLAPERKVRADLSRYTVVKQVKTASGRASVDVNDIVAAYFRGMPIDEVYAHATLFLYNMGITEVGSKGKKTLATNAALRERYEHLNIGMQRMNLGNVVRNGMKKLGIEEIPFEPVKPTMEL